MIVPLRFLVLTSIFSLVDHAMLLNVLVFLALCSGWFVFVLLLRPIGVSPFLLKSELQHTAVDLPKHSLGLLHAFVCFHAWLLDMIWGILTPDRLLYLRLFTLSWLVADFVYDWYILHEMQQIRSGQYRLQTLEKERRYTSDEPKMTEARLHQPFQKFEMTSLYSTFAHHALSGVVLFGIGWHSNAWFAYSFWFRESWSQVQHTFSLLYVFLQTASGAHASFSPCQVDASKAVPRQTTYEKDLPQQQRPADFVNSVTQASCTDRQANLVPLLRMMGVASAVLFMLSLMNFALGLFGGFWYFEWGNIFAYPLLLGLLYFGNENIKTMNLLFEKNNLGRLTHYLLVFVGIVGALALFLILRLLSDDVFAPYWKEASAAVATFTSAAMAVERMTTKRSPTNSTTLSAGSDDAHSTQLRTMNTTR